MVAQSISRHEYWIDKDYANRQSVSQGGTTFQASVSLEGLTPGLHYLNYRAQNSDGVWGTLHRMLFYLPDNALTDNESVSSEYWIDSDYANRKSGQNAETMTATVDISQLTAGLHFFNYRALNSYGEQGLLNRTLFYIPEYESENPEITEYEYWIDNDTEHKVTCTEIQEAFQLAVDVSALKDGEHTFSFRAKNSDGVWGSVYTESFDVDNNAVILPEAACVSQTPVYAEGGEYNFSYSINGRNLDVKVDNPMNWVTAEGGMYCREGAEDVINEAPAHHVVTPADESVKIKLIDVGPGADEALYQKVEYTIVALADKKPDRSLSRESFLKNHAEGAGEIRKNHLYETVGYDGSVYYGQDTPDWNAKGSYGAITMPATHGVPFNGEIDLARFVETHYSKASDDAGPAVTDQVMDQQMMDSLGLSYQFRIVNYMYANRYFISESAYLSQHDGRMKGSLFVPRMVDMNGNTIADQPANRAVIDREPLIRVDLVDRYGNIIRYGYIKIIITDAKEEPADILTPIAKEITYGEESHVDETTDLNASVVDNVYYNIPEENGGYDPEEECVVVNKATSESEIEDIVGEDLQSDEVKTTFTGIVIELPVGSGFVTVEAQTTGGMTLKVKVGNAAPLEMELEGKLKMKVPYDVDAPTYVYIYAGEKPSAVRTRDGVEPSLKIYGIGLEMDGDMNGDHKVNVADIVKDVNDSDGKNIPVIVKEIMRKGK